MPKSQYLFLRDNLGDRFKIPYECPPCRSNIVAWCWTQCGPRRARVGGGEAGKNKPPGAVATLRPSFEVGLTNFLTANGRPASKRTAVKNGPVVSATIVGTSGLTGTVQVGASGCHGSRRPCRQEGCHVKRPRITISRVGAFVRLTR